MSAEVTEKKRNKKATNHEMILRINAVQQLIVEGKPRRVIHQVASERWGCNERSADDLMARARKAWVEELNSIDRREMVGEIASKFAHIYEKACETRQLAVAHASMTALMKIMALDRGAL